MEKKEGERRHVCCVVEPGMTRVEGHTGLPGTRGPLVEGSSCTGLVSIVNITSRVLGSAFSDISPVEGLVGGVVRKANRTPAAGSQRKA